MSQLLGISISQRHVLLLLPLTLHPVAPGLTFLSMLSWVITNASCHPSSLLTLSFTIAPQLAVTKAQERENEAEISLDYLNIGDTTDTNPNIQLHRVTVWKKVLWQGSHITASDPVQILVKSIIFLLDFCLAKVMLTSEKEERKLT